MYNASKKGVSIKMSHSIHRYLNNPICMIFSGDMGLHPDADCAFGMTVTIDTILPILYQTKWTITVVDKKSGKCEVIKTTR